MFKIEHVDGSFRFSEDFKLEVILLAGLLTDNSRRI